MASLQTLPTELIISIFAAGKIHAALKLSAVNSRLQTIWTEHASSIAERILATQIPAYGDAVNVASAETECFDENAAKPDIKVQSSSGTSGNWLRRLLQNAEMASEVCNGWRRHVALIESHNSEDDPKIACKEPIEVSYYLLRRLALCHYRPELQQDIASKLANESMGDLLAHENLRNYIKCQISEELLEKLGIAQPEEEWDDRDDLSDEHPTVEAWASWGPTRLIRVAIMEKKRADPSIDLVDDFTLMLRRMMR